MKTPLQELMYYMEQNQYFIGNDLLSKYKELLEKEKDLFCQFDKIYDDYLSRGIIKKHYVTFAKHHVHSIMGRNLDKDAVAVFYAFNRQDGRQKALNFFKNKFFTDYHDTEWKEDNLLRFPKGYVELF